MRTHTVNITFFQGVSALYGPAATLCISPSASGFMTSTGDVRVKYLGLALMGYLWWWCTDEVLVVRGPLLYMSWWIN